MSTTKKIDFGYNECFEVELNNGSIYIRIDGHDHDYVSRSITSEQAIAIARALNAAAELVTP